MYSAIYYGHNSAFRGRPGILQRYDIDIASRLSRMFLMYKQNQIGSDSRFVDNLEVNLPGSSRIGGLRTVTNPKRTLRIKIASSSEQ